MMRSMYSGVSGLKTHQTKMDVIGNNIANVNTVAFKGSSTTFSEIMYQKLSGASGATERRGGVNAKQIGLGVSMASTTTNISSPGATQSTGGAFDLAITGDSFFIVSDGAGNYFTKAGAFEIDGAGNLVMKSTGYTVMGWQAITNEDGTTDIRKDTVSPLRLMTNETLTSPPEATTQGTCSGILDKNSSQVKSDEGYMMNLNFFDALGYSYTARFSVKATNNYGEYTVELTDILNSKGVSITKDLNAAQLSDIVSFGSQTIQTETIRMEMDESSYAYDETTKTYYKKVLFPETATNFNATRVTEAIYSTDSAQYNLGARTVTVEGKVSLSADEFDKLYDKYGIVWDKKKHTYLHIDDNGTQTEITTADQWKQYMGLGATATLDASGIDLNTEDGTIILTFNQQFDVDPNLVQDATDPTGIYRIPTTQTEAFGGDVTDPNKTYTFEVLPSGDAIATVTTIMSANILKFDTDTGLFKSIANGNAVTLDFNGAFTDRAGQTISLGNFSDISVDFTSTKWFDNGGSSTMGTDAGGTDGVAGKGKKLGDMIGLSVSQDGTIWASYDNGNTVLLGQIAVAVFPNPAGLEKVGENCYQTTLNSGDFDGIGQDVTAGGGKMTSGVLEMSNVDLANEFTEMITSQRGFQANSRIITTSDTLLEELINLKR